MADHSGYVRDKYGKFQAGQSGNPKGRPEGSRNKLCRLSDQIFEERREDVARVVLEGALAKDACCLQIASTYYQFKRSGRPVPFVLPEVSNAEGVVAAIASVVAAVSEGRLSLEEGQAYTALLEQQRKAVETADLAERIAALESVSGNDHDRS